MFIDLEGRGGITTGMSYVFNNINDCSRWCIINYTCIFEAK